MNEVVEIDSGAIAAVSKIPPDEARSKRIAEAFLNLARGYEVKTQEDYDQAAVELRSIIARHTAMDTERKSFTDPLREVLERLNAKYQPWLKLLRGDGKKDTENAEAILKAKMSAFLVEQERLAAEERRKAEVLAQAERDRLAAEAECVRKEAAAAAEVLRKAEEARAAAAREAQAKIDAEAAAARGKKVKAEAEARAQKAREDEEARVAQARLEADEAAARREREAQALETTAAVVIAQPVITRVSAGRGISTPKTYQGVVVDKLALVKHIVEKREDLLVLLDVNEVQLKRLVLMMGEATNLPGVRVDIKTGISVR